MTDTTRFLHFTIAAAVIAFGAGVLIIKEWPDKKPGPHTLVVLIGAIASIGTLYLVYTKDFPGIFGFR